MRDALWPSVRDLAEAPDLLERAVQQVQSMGVVNRRAYQADIPRWCQSCLRPAYQSSGEGCQ
jgi:hypothetical protein